MDVHFSLPLGELPYFSARRDAAPPTQPALGAQSQLVFGTIGGKSVVALQGRLHYYECESMNEVVFPIRIMALMGVQSLILTNSAGGLDSKMSEGDFMIIEDHINLMGANPLIGTRARELGPHNPDLTLAYDERLLKIMEDLMTELSYPFHKGVYAAVSGPTFETKAEVRYLKMIGCAAVGMSLVPEVIAAVHLGLRVAAISCITSVPHAYLEGRPRKQSSEEIGWTARRVESQFSRFMQSFLERI